MIMAQLPRSMMAGLIEEIKKHEPTFIPKLPEVIEERKEIVKDMHLDKGYLEFKEKLARGELSSRSRNAWFYLWTSPYWRFWALNPNCTEPTPACRTTPYSCSSYGDVHWEYLAYDYQISEYTTVMFNAKCRGCGTFHVCCNDSTFPRTPGWRYLQVDMWGICDCVCQVYPFTNGWQNVVAKWTCTPSPCP